MALDSYPILGPDGLTATERARKTIRDLLREHLPNVDDDVIWQLTLAIQEAAPWGIPSPPTSLLYAWSAGQTYSTVDRDTGIPDQARERAILGGILTHALRVLDERDHPLRLVTVPT